MSPTSVVGSASNELILRFAAPITVVNTPAGWFGDGVHPGISLTKTDTNEVTCVTVLDNTVSATVPAPPNGVTDEATGAPLCAGVYLLED